MGTLEILIRLGALLFLAGIVFNIVRVIIIWIIAFIYIMLKGFFEKGEN